ncbi:acyl transferase [Chitinophagaceae bacterium IBVUCB1]|nr:acyl transferase [Chitinophagaceae bacterium IBVUCB1]
MATNTFENAAIKLFRHQYTHNNLYANYCKQLGKKMEDIGHITDIPFLPISFFRTQPVLAGDQRDVEVVFESSGTTNTETSKHYVLNTDIYRASLIEGFQHFYGDIQDYTIIALLPGYLERNNASLIYMAKVLMEESKKQLNGFYLEDFEKLHKTLTILESKSEKAILLGVTFALLDFAVQFPISLKSTIVMETGGMKGRKKEMTRNEVHNTLCKQFGLDKIHAEYGMTELLSQAYSGGNGKFLCTPTMQVLVRDVNDPFDIKTHGPGCINIIDVANVNSCPFIATDDIGIIHTDGSFEILGRIDNSILRGCNLMVV